MLIKSKKFTKITRISKINSTDTSGKFKMASGVVTHNRFLDQSITENTKVTSD